MDGVFKSWAVTKGPSLDPHDKRLAVEVEDHPLNYGDFEGTIAKGQYGGGTVMVWDRGYWNCEDPKRAYLKGKLDFTLQGEKLHGGWILTRMRKRDGEKRTNWLLIKHRDEFAREGKKNRILEEDTSVASSRSMDEITTGKSRGPKPFIIAKRSRAPTKAEWKSHRASARAPAAKKRSRPPTSRSPRKWDTKKRKTAADQRMPSFIAPQLGTSVERPPAGGDWVHEIKFDGYRIQMRVESGEVTLKTRKGLDWAPKFGAIARAASKLPDCIMDGEIVALDNRGSPDFAGLQAALSDGKMDDLIFFAFDLLFGKGEDVRQQSLVNRKRALKAVIEKAYGKNRPKFATSSISKTAAKRCSNPPAGCHWKESFETSRRPLRFRTDGVVDKSQVPRGTRGRHRRLEQQRKPVQVADGRRLSGRSPGLCRQCRNGLR